MELKRMKLEEITPAEYNPRVDLQPGDPEYERLRKSLQEFGLVDPLVFNKRTGRLVGGHQRVKVLQDLGYTEADVSLVDLPAEKEQALNLALNKIEGRWDEDALRDVLDNINKWIDEEMPDFDIEATGFSEQEIDDLIGDTEGLMDGADYMDGDGQSLAERFVVPPFTVLDARQGYWRQRKEEWYAKGIITEAGREDLDDTTASGWVSRGRDQGGSAFDPVLAEIAFKWFCPEGGAVLDPFAGESTKGIVAGLLGFSYTGVEVRKDQVDANYRQLEAMPEKPGGEVRWITGDAAKLESVLPQGQEYDFIFTSPPYYDLEVYSSEEADGSTFGSYAEFMAWYEHIFKQAVAQLKENAFVVVKVGEIRDKKTGAYRNFVGDNISCFKGLGLHYYNEAILVTPVGSLPLRAGRQFEASRKLGKAHQNILVFYKGDLNKIKDLQFVEVELDEDGSVTLESEAETAAGDGAQVQAADGGGGNVKMKLGKVADNALPREAMELYNATGSVPFAKKFNACPELGEYLKLVYGAGDQELTLQEVDCPKPIPLQDNGTCWVSFTGGKDSVAAAIRAQERGYKVIPYYLQGINRGVADELHYAQKICDRMGWPLVVDKISISGKKSGVVEMPTKNQVIVLCMLGRMAEQGGAAWTAGYHEDTAQAERGWGFDFSDGDKAVALFNAYLEKRVPGVKFLMLLQDTLECWALCADYGLINYIKGCACQPRFKEMRRKKNVEKFGAANILHGRCGSCIKCAWEQVALQRLGIVPESRAVRQHGLKFLEQFKSVWNTGGRDMENYLVPQSRAEQEKQARRGRWPKQPMPD